MTPQPDSHSTTNPKPEIQSAVLTGNRISRDGRNVRCIMHMHMCRKDDILAQRRLNHCGVGGRNCIQKSVHGPSLFGRSRSCFSSMVQNKVLMHSKNFSTKKLVKKVLVQNVLAHEKGSSQLKCGPKKIMSEKMPTSNNSHTVKFESNTFWPKKSYSRRILFKIDFD